MRILHRNDVHRTCHSSVNERPYQNGRFIGIVVLLFTMLSATSNMTFAQTTTLTMVLDPREQYRAWQETMIDKFEEQNPHIKVETWGASGNLHQQLLVRIIGGVPPDLAYHDPHVIVDFARQGLALDLTPYIERDSDQFSDWLPSAFDLFKFRGGQYALPIELQIGAIFYNVDAFDESGIPYPGMDWTYADLLDHARRLRRTDEHGEVTRHGFKLPTWRNWLSPIWAYGGDFVDDWSDPTTFIGNSPETIAALDYLHNLVESEAVQDQETHRQWGIGNAFIQQRIAMGQTNTLSIHNFQAIEDFSWDVAPLPTGPAGQVAFLNARGWFILNDSPHKEEAWELLRFLTSTESQEIMIDIIGGVPPDRNNVVNYWLPGLTTPRSRHLITTGVETARAPGVLPATIYDAIFQESHSVIWGDKPIMGALEDMERRVNNAISELQN